MHIPFCEKKCAYCDFYSGFASDEMLDKYTEALIKSIKQWGGKFHRPIDTIYLGGGTPSLLNERISKVLDAVRTNFEVLEDTEITLELNPKGDIEEILKNAKKSGVNRLSIGMQSANDDELKVLGRSHSFADTKNTVKMARNLGFSNISLDLMIGLPYSDIKTLEKSLEEIVCLNPEHISAYILKIEERTAFYKKAESLSIPSDDEVCDQYLYMCDYLESKGYSHYEISNFAKENKQSRHNLKYWQGVDYLGIGASAHSSIDGERFYYPRDLSGFIKGNEPVLDGFSGDMEEFIMLRLRLSSGINSLEFKEIYGKDLPEKFYNKCRLFEKGGLMRKTENGFALTNNGMLLSNSIITELLEGLT